MSQPKRILLGTTEVVRQLYDLADAFRQIGYEAETALSWPDPFTRHLQYNYLLTNDIPFPNWIRESSNPLIRYPRGLAYRSYKQIKKTRIPYFLTAYDVYVFQFGRSFLPRNRDYQLLKWLGKKIICIFLGSDIRHWSANEPARESFGMDPCPGYRNGQPLNEALMAMRMAEKYADVIFSQPSYSDLAVRPYMHCYLAINLELYGWSVPSRDVPVVVHAPSRRDVKGTGEILATLEQLKASGVAFELRLLEGVSNEEVIRQLLNADVLVDQLNESNYGVLAVEAMATGCAVASGNHPGLVPLPPNRPVVHIDRRNIYSQLRRLLTDKKLRLQLAHAGRSFVKQHHDYVNVAQRMLACLDSDGKRKSDYYPTFFASRYRLPEGERIGDCLKHLTTQIIQRYGLPEDVDPKDMIARGLISEDRAASMPIPRWPPFRGEE